MNEFVYIMIEGIILCWKAIGPIAWFWAQMFMHWRKCEISKIVTNPKK
jgi:hypothetical protein